MITILFNKSEFSEKELKKSTGFTLLEVIIIATITVMMTGFLLTSFGSKARRLQAVRRSAVAIQADLRRIQALAIAGRGFAANQICGYGIRYLDTTHYQIYKGSTESLNCLNTNHNYQAGIDTIFQTLAILEKNVNFSVSFLDVFFEPPDPKIYINNNSNLNVSPLQINLCYVNTNDCKIIFIYTSGRIEVQ